MLVNVLTGEEIRDNDVLARNIGADAMIGYLQELMDDFVDCKERYGMDSYVVGKMDAMIACKEMVEALIGYPVNLRKDGKVTIGF